MEDRKKNEVDHAVIKHDADVDCCCYDLSNLHVDSALCVIRPTSLVPNKFSKQTKKINK